MLCLSGFELYSRWVPLKECLARFRTTLFKSSLLELRALTTGRRRQRGPTRIPKTIDLVTVFDAILTSRQTREKLQ